MNLFQQLWLTIVIFFSQPESFKVGKYLVTVVAPTGAVPNHLTFAQIQLAIKQVLLLGAGTLQVGNVTLIVTLVP